MSKTSAVQEQVKEKKMHIGKVVSDKMDKTVVVRLTRNVKHPMFGKVLKKSKNYKVHDPLEQAQVGDIVEFFEGRPVSKTKYMYLSRVVQKTDEDILLKEDVE